MVLSKSDFRYPLNLRIVVYLQQKLKQKIDFEILPSTFQTRPGPPSLPFSSPPFSSVMFFFYILVPYSATRLAAPVILTPHRVEYGVSHHLTPSSSPVTVLYCTVLHCTALHCTALHCTVLYCTSLYCI